MDREVVYSKGILGILMENRKTQVIVLPGLDGKDRGKEQTTKEKDRYL